MKRQPIDTWAQRQALYGKPEYTFIAERAWQALAEVQDVNPRICRAAIESMKAKFE